MKVLFVDQLGRTTGRDTLALCSLLNRFTDVDIVAYMSDTTVLDVSNYDFKIKKGFHGAYEGNFVNKGKNYLRTLKHLKKYVCNNKIDIVHLQWFSIPWIEWMFIDSLKHYCKVAITVHDIIPFDNRFGEMWGLRKIYNAADQLFVHTENAKEQLKLYYSPQKPIRVITQAFCNKDDYYTIDKQEARNKLDLPSDAVVFLFYGTIRPSKGLDLLFKAIRSANKKYRCIHLLVGGAFHNVEENEYKSVAEKMVEEGIATVNFEYVPFEQEILYFSAADVLCLPYRELTQSGVAQLGLMYNLPMIAADVGSMSEVIRNEYNGLLFEANDEDGLEQCICKMMNFYDRECYAKRSEELAKTEFSLDEKANRIYNAYKEMKVNYR